MPQINYLFVVNPISGGNDKSAFYRFIEEENQRMGFSYELYKTTGTDDESRLIKLVIHHKPEVIVAVGGDGTLLLAAKVVKNSSIKIGLIPFGSANGMSRELNIPKIPDISLSLNPSQRFKECWNIIKNERVQEVDLLQINKNHYSLHLSDIGLNAKIVKRFEAEKIRGYFGYARLFFKELKQKKRISYRLVADGIQYQGKAYMIVIANATMYGTGAVINPVGKLDDGVFEICLVKQIKFVSLLRSLVSIFKKKLQPRKDLMKVVICKNAIIEIKEAETLQVDGEVVGEVKQVKIKILPGALRIIT
ncbi:MAG: NAD(+)/NADH kinase [Cyclobacteriaceae bacterium]|nr:NAD(+)/NADH kinase [Cyclobacteriaceae bacterium]MCK5468562.1 NAD(+)/NADH kinase [Cyclobacteriaceae bacterium]MCK5702085.1 NAD(+)/NADH kinase [Cyclobacteriaceae bacterium]